MNLKILGREPVLWLALVSALVMGAGRLFDLSRDQQGVLNALAVAIIGVITAFVLKVAGGRRRRRHPRPGQGGPRPAAGVRAQDLAG